MKYPVTAKAWNRRYCDKLTIDQGTFSYFSLKKLAADFQFHLAAQPLVLRIFLENVLRNYDAEAPKIIKALSSKSKSHNITAFPYYPARVLLQDYTGVPAIADLAAMRDTIAEAGGDPQVINPCCPVDLVIDHSVIVERAGASSASAYNRRIEMSRNNERYQFLKWAQKSFKNLTIVPPGKGICHQLNLEYFSQVVSELDGVLVPDTLVGTDSHTTMVNGLGVLGWGVGGIEAEAAMLGQPLSLNLPEIIGVELQNKLPPGTTATDLVLTITERLRYYGVVGKYVEFYGSGISSLSVADRATIANMAPEYGATCGLFPIDDKVLEYLKLTDRPAELIERVSIYCKAQELFYDSNSQVPDYPETLQVDLAQIEPSVAGPKRPQDRLALSAIKSKTIAEIKEQNPHCSLDEQSSKSEILDGDVVIAAITSCTNTSNPNVMLMAGLLAKAAVERGLRVKAHVKTSLAPGSQAVARYLDNSGLQDYLDQLGFQRIGFGCTTCIGNSGPLNGDLEEQILDRTLCVSAVLSGNRNFEGRIHSSVRLNWLASPPLVVAFALAGHTRIDLNKDPLSKDLNGREVFLKDLWPSAEMVEEALLHVTQKNYQLSYQNIFKGDEAWEAMQLDSSLLYKWKDSSTYIQRPPFFDRAPPQGPLEGARILAVLGHSITTDHISPAGRISTQSPAGRYLLDKGVEWLDFNSYGARRGNHQVMKRGTFDNKRIKNLIASPREGGLTCFYDQKGCSSVMPIYEASKKYLQENTALVIFAGKEYGTGSSRDWAAKGPLLLNVKAVIAESFERIHRSNLVGMGILPLELNSLCLKDLQLCGSETVSINWDQLQPAQQLELTLAQGTTLIKKIAVTARIDNSRELEYFNAGGVLAYVAGQFMSLSKGEKQ
ncbi:aconitate hydratase AcnA [Lentisphaera marina]|uniref:aconitate hydratase AcnA n=1 Tax=Lentisphaera marina TaxID=1111041 RepID=UPI0023666663|nr:aconitate hydratase AcnA [Lentisphaera marina]MDD7984425.1 aconitate hydratase AcnA [Lentisphaera marina]